MKKNLFSQFFTIGLGTIINMLIGLITTPIITRLVEPSDYGQLSIFNTYTNVLVMVLCLGLDQALVRFYYDKKTLEYKHSLLMICSIIPLIFSIIVSTIIVIFSFVSGEFLRIYTYM